MAIEYAFRIATTSTLESLREILATIPALRREGGSLRAAGVNAVEFMAETEVGKAEVRKTLGISPTARVIFILYKDERLIEGEESVAAAFGGLVRGIISDFVLLLDHEIVIAYRRDGLLKLNSNSSFWKARDLSFLGQPYAFSSLENLD